MPCKLLATHLTGYIEIESWSDGLHQSVGSGIMCVAQETGLYK